MAEWAVRIVLSYAIAPSDRTDPCDPAQVDRLVVTFMLPGIDALQRDGNDPIDITPYRGNRPVPEAPVPSA